MKFNAKTFCVNYDETEVLTVGFLEDDSYNNFINIQYLDDFDEQELALNWTKYYLEIGNNGSDCIGAYNCIADINVTRKSIKIILNQYGKERFKLTDIFITYILDDINYKNLIDSLNTIFTNEENVKLTIMTL